MHDIYGTGLWRQHRDDLLREAEHGRLVRQLKETRRNKAGLREMLLRRLQGGAAGGLRTGDEPCA